MHVFGDDPFLAAQAVGAGTDGLALAADARSEIVRLVAFGDLFGAGLVLARAVGRPLKAFGVPPAIVR
jgi:hypothetical protein